MSAQYLVSVPMLKGSFPFTVNTLYSGRVRGRYPWLQREGPDGQRGKFLWVDMRAFDIWAANKGIGYRFNVAQEGRQH